MDDTSGNSPSKASDWFSQVIQTFTQAADAVGFIEHSIQIGPFTLRLRFAGSGMIPTVYTALEHLAVLPTRLPDLTVCIWDYVTTSIPLPPPPWSANDYGSHGHIRGYNDGRFHTSFDVRSGALNMLDDLNSTAVMWCRDASQLPVYQRGSPLRAILGWWLSNRNCQLVHAAAIGKQDGGVLLVGKGGSGKSTSALSSLDSELGYAGDDYCAIMVDPEPYVYSVYNTAKVNTDNLHRVTPNAHAAIANAERTGAEKALLFLQGPFPEKLSRGFPVRAILLPRVTNLPPTNLSPASPAAALQALAPSSLFGRPGSQPIAFQMMARLVRRIPAYYLNLAEDVAAIPALVLRLIDQERLSS